MSAEECGTCGRPLNEHDRHVRYSLPDPVWEIPEPEREGRMRGGNELLQVEGVGAFVRALLPVHLTGGYAVTFGTWLGVQTDDLKHAWEIWNKPKKYRLLEVDGFLANAIPPWGGEILAVPATARVLDPTQFPYMIESVHPILARVIRDEWDHEFVLPALPPI